MNTKRKQILGSVLCILFCQFVFSATPAVSQEPEHITTADAAVGDNSAVVREHWTNLLHYATIGRWDLADGHGRALLQAQPEPVELLDLAEEPRFADSYRKLGLLKIDSPLREVAEQILDLVEQGRFARRTDPDRIAAEVTRLSGTTRGRMMAIERLKDSGEWAVPIMIEVMRDPSRTEELSNIRWALPQIGRAAVNPLVVVAQQCRQLNIRLIAIEALGKIGYPSSLAYIRQVFEDEQSSTELKTAALAKLQQIGDRQKAVSAAAELFEQLAEDYYSLVDSLAVPADQDFGNVWFWLDEGGLYAEPVPRGAFDELMAMRCCEIAVSLDPQRPDAIALWLAAFYRLEAEGFDQPVYFGENHADAATYALTAGAEYLHRVLVRALADRNRPVALGAIHALQRNAGQQSLLFRLGIDQPLINSLAFADREVRFSAALAIGGVLPKQPFAHSEQVTPILAEAILQKGRRTAVIVETDQNRRNATAAELRQIGGFDDVVSDGNFSVALEQARSLRGVDLIVLGYNIQQPDIDLAIKIIEKDFRLAFCPVLVLSDMQKLSAAKQFAENRDFVDVALFEKATIEFILDSAKNIMARNNSRPFEAALADSYATQAAGVLQQLALTGNKVLDLSLAEPALLRAAYDDRRMIQFAAVNTLGRMDSVKAQREIATLALDETFDMEVRLMSLHSLAVSAKAYGNLLAADQVDAIYRIVGAIEQDDSLRNLAAEAYGSLNLPSAKTSRLILDQMR